MRPSDLLRNTRAFQEDPNLRVILDRYRDWTPERWSTDQMCFDIGYLFGVIEQLDAERKNHESQRA